MSPRLPSPRQLEQLFQDLEDGALSADDHAWLMSLLRERPEIRAAYREHMVLATGLHDLAEAWAPDHEEPVRDSAEIVQRRTLRKSFLAAAALVALLAVAGSLIAIRGRMLPPATATAGAGTVWRFDGGGIDGSGSFVPATRVVVEYGTLEIVTRNRTRILLEGPAEFEIHDPQRTSLAHGKGWFDVAEKDTGFTVLTERLEIIDLGTQFGVAASAATDRIQVESGHVRLKSRFPGIPSLDLSTGQAAESDLVGRSKLMPYDPGLFVRGLPREPVSIHWSFDEEQDGAFPATASGIDPAPLRIHSFDGGPASPRIATGRFGSAVDFTGGKLFGESAFPGISGSGPRTIALWFKGKPIPRRMTRRAVDYTPTLVSWGDASVEGASWTLRAHCASGIIGTQWGSNGWTTAGEIGSRNIHDNRWHHLATVFTGKVDESGNLEIRHYIDGERVRTTQAVMGVGVETRADRDDPSSHLRIAFDAQDAGGPTHVPAMIDELHVIRAALDDDEIGLLFRENRLEAAP